MYSRCKHHHHFLCKREFMTNNIVQSPKCVMCGHRNVSTYSKPFQYQSKPKMSRSFEVMAHFPNVEEPSQLCMMGDRLLTDVVFGNLHGMLTVHILPLCSGKENSKDNTVAKVKVVRAAENKFMYADWWGGRKTRSYTFEGS